MAPNPNCTLSQFAWVIFIGDLTCHQHTWSPIQRFDLFGPCTFIPVDRPVFLLSDRPLFDFRTVHIRGLSTSSHLDRPLWHKTVRFRPDPSKHLCSICGNMFPIYELCFQSKFTVSNLRILFPISIHCFQCKNNVSNLKSLFPMYFFCFQSKKMFPI